MIFDICDLFYVPGSGSREPLNLGPIWIRIRNTAKTYKVRYTLNLSSDRLIGTKYRRYWYLHTVGNFMLIIKTLYFVWQNALQKCNVRVKWSIRIRIKRIRWTGYATLRACDCGIFPTLREVGTMFINIYYLVYIISETYNFRNFAIQKISLTFVDFRANF